MRKNLYTTFHTWKKCETRKLKNDSVSTDGVNIYSYETPIAKWIIPGFIAILNKTRYSKTTSSQQNSLRALLSANDILFQEECEEDFNKWGNDEA